MHFTFCLSCFKQLQYLYLHFLNIDILEVYKINPRILDMSSNLVTQELQNSEVQHAHCTLKIPQRLEKKNYRLNMAKNQAKFANGKKLPRKNKYIYTFGTLTSATVCCLGLKDSIFASPRLFFFSLSLFTHCPIYLFIF